MILEKFKYMTADLSANAIPDRAKDYFDYVKKLIAVAEAAEACVGYIGKNPEALNLQKELKELENWIKNEIRILS